MMKSVLVVEDEASIRDLVCLHLGLEGYECVPCGNGRDALKLAAGQAFDLVVLDLMVPVVDGLAICRALRREGLNQDVPILMLTARREESDKVLGLESGADDYLTKPFGVRELVARVRALARRPRARVAEAPGAGGEAGDRRRPLTRHGLEIDPSRRRVLVGGQPVALTNQEFNLLYVLAANPGIVFSREALLTKIWKGDTFVTVRSVDTLVKRLRHKIEHETAAPRLILTVWGVGYKFLEDE